VKQDEPIGNVIDPHVNPLFDWSNVKLGIHFDLSRFTGITVVFDGKEKQINPKDLFDAL
jgi:hypothetical protein